MKKVLEWAKGLVGEQILAMILSRIITVENIQKVIVELIEFLKVLAAKTETKIDDRAVEVLEKALIK